MTGTDSVWWPLAKAHEAYVLPRASRKAEAIIPFLRRPRRKPAPPSIAPIRPRARHSSGPSVRLT